MPVLGEVSGVEDVDDREVAVQAEVSDWNVRISRLVYLISEPFSAFHKSHHDVFEGVSDPRERWELVILGHYRVSNDREVCHHSLQSKELKPLRRNFTL